MTAYLINGPSGTGKTSIGNELEKRGYTVVNTDEALGYYANLATEEAVEFPGDDVTELWYSKNGWIWDKKKFNKLLSESTDITFFCGGSLNEPAFYPQFSNVVRLVVSPDVLVQRIQSRKGDKNTNNPYFIKLMLDALKTARADAEKLGWVVVDTSHKSVKTSTDETLTRLGIH